MTTSAPVTLGLPPSIESNYHIQQIQAQIRIGNLQHKKYTVQKWRRAVRVGSLLSYREWLALQISNEFEVVPNV